VEQSRGLSETVEAIKQLRALGATRVRIGNVSADFSGAGRSAGSDAPAAWAAASFSRLTSSQISSR